MLFLSVFKDAFLTTGVAIAASGRDQLWFCGAQAPPWGLSFAVFEVIWTHADRRFRLHPKQHCWNKNFKWTQEMPVIRGDRYTKQKIRKEPGENWYFKENIIDGVNNRADIAEEWSRELEDCCCVVLVAKFVWLSCDPMDCSLPGVSVYEIF